MFSISITKTLQRSLWLTIPPSCTSTSIREWPSEQLGHSYDRFRLQVNVRRLGNLVRLKGGSAQPTPHCKEAENCRCYSKKIDQEGSVCSVNRHATIIDLFLSTKWQSMDAAYDHTRRSPRRLTPLPFPSSLCAPD